jgi:outer membrane lipoprotein-sorting protein
MGRMNRPVMAVVVVALLAACGTPGAPAKPPTAQEILAKPAHSNLKDAHFMAAGKIVNQGTTVDINGDGELVYKSPGAGRFKFQTTVAGQLVSFEQITVNGTDYTFTTPGSGKWTSKASTSTSALDPQSFEGTSGFKYIGEENLSQGKAWHASAKDSDGNAFDGWIRESDGYPLKYVLTQSATTSGNTLTLTFDEFNTGVSISPPPAAQVVQG